MSEETGELPLRELRVVDLSTGIAGAYATRLFCESGAEVLKVEPEGGDPLRRWSATGADLSQADGALFRFLGGGKRSLLGSPEDETVQRWIRSADLVVESFAPTEFDAEGLAEAQPGLVVLSITGYGRSGPWRDRPWTEFTLQAQCGSIGTRGLRDREPFQAGGRITEWVGGTFAAVAALAAVRRARLTGHGEHVDFSLHEVMTIAGTNFQDLTARILGVERFRRLPQSVETPSIEPSADGYVGFCTNSRQQLSDFMLMIERPDLRDDEELAQVMGRAARFDEWNEIVRSWTRRHTTDEILKAASLLRIPVAPVLHGASVHGHEQVVTRRVLRERPDSPGVQPRPPWRFDDRDPPEPRRAPRLGEHADQPAPAERQRPPTDAPCSLPLAGLRILDMTAWWAGPSATQMLAALGAEVIHLESTSHPDGIRMTGGMAQQRFEDWWEASAFFASVNTNKLGLTLDLGHSEGLALARRLIERCDAVVENFSPRVLDGFGLDFEGIRRIHPGCIPVRMPAFGLSGPWREHTGFAQTMEQLSGLAWITGHPDDQPRIQRGPCDPLAGMHAAFALIAALFVRDRSGRAPTVECTMLEGALNAAAEQLLEHGDTGRLLERMGNRSPGAAPQGLYPCAGHAPRAPRWLALSVETEEHWKGLIEVLGMPAWSRDPALGTRAGRHAAHASIDAKLRAWAAAGERDALVEALLAAGVPAAPVADPRAASHCPQHRARGFFEELDHPCLGPQPLPGPPFRFRRHPGPWLRRPAPTLGEHNREILGELLGIGDDELARLEREGVIGTRPSGI